MKICTECLLPKNDTEFFKRLGRYRSKCKKCVTIATGNWKKINREKANGITKRSREKRRKLCIDHYGGKCHCCSETIFEFLAIDHINGGGTQHIKSLGNNGTALYSWLIKNNFPLGFRVLCYNCNASFGINNACPHQSHISHTNSRYSILRQLCIDEYGGKCACCSDSTREFLAIDHVNGGGCKHRKIMNNGMSLFYWLKRNNFPADFRLLCHNCNAAIGLYKTCPHITKTNEMSIVNYEI